MKFWAKVTLAWTVSKEPSEFWGWQWTAQEETRYVRSLTW